MLEFTEYHETSIFSPIRPRGDLRIGAVVDRVTLVTHNNDTRITLVLASTWDCETPGENKYQSFFRGLGVMMRDLPYSRLRDAVLVAKVFVTLIFSGTSIAVNVSEPLDGTAEGSFELT